MKTKTYNLIITSISEVHGEYPGSVDVNFHRELDGKRDGFDSQRVSLSSKIINKDGSVNSDTVADEVVAAIGETEVVDVAD